MNRRGFLLATRAPAPSLQTLDLAQLASGLVRLVTPLARKQGCAIALEVDEPVHVRADAARVEQILFNLVSNAIQAGARTVRPTVTDCNQPALRVADDGPGLPESVRERLFEPFVTTKPAGQGTGQGLAISQRLAREMGAELTCENPGPGCVFSLRFTSASNPVLISHETQPPDKTQNHSFPFKGKAGMGMGFTGDCRHQAPHPHPNPPLEGEGTLLR